MAQRFRRSVQGELHTELGEEGVREFMRNVGRRFAGQFSPDPCRTLEELECAIAQIWLDIDWGWTSIKDIGDALVVRHHCAPLSFGTRNDEDHWHADFLQGAYQH